MKLALIQMNCQPDRAHNLAQAERLMREACSGPRPDLIVLPEHFDWTGGTPEDKREAADVVPGGEAYETVRAFARDHQVAIHAGSLLERVVSGERVFNTTVIFDSTGAEIGTYRKIHLFDIIAPDGKRYLESATVAAGKELLIYEIGGFRVACAICYDLRFSGLFDRLASFGVDLFILPAAFTQQTGKDHWEVLCRARAIEFQAFFAACGQCGSYLAPGNERRAMFGHSLVVDPWGHVIARTGDEEGVLYADLDRRRVAEVRALIPMNQHRVDLETFRINEVSPADPGLAVE